MSVNWAKDYQPVVYEYFLEGLDMVPSLIPSLFDVRQSNKANEYALGVGGIPVELWEKYEQDGETASADLDRGYPTTFTHKEYTLAWPLKKKHIEDDETGLIQESFNSVGVSAAQRRETHAASVFNNAFSSSYTGPDSVSLCNASHPVGPDNTGTTRDNTGTSALTYANVVAARSSMRAWNDGQENPYMANGRLVLIPTELESNAIEMFEALAKPGTANNDANAVRGFEWMMWDYLSDTNNWFLIDPMRSRRFLRWYNRSTMVPTVVKETTTEIVYEFRMRYSYGWTHWSWVYGNEVG